MMDEREPRDAGASPEDGAFERRLRAALRREWGEGPAAVPPGFADRVMRAIEAREAAAAAGPERAESEAGSPAGAAAAAAPGSAGTIRRAVDALLRPRTLVWRPVYALAAAVLVAAAAGALALLDPAAGPGESPGLAAGGEPGETAAPGDPALEGPAIARAGADTVFVRFVFEDPGARTVAVAGDFSRWEPIELAPRWRNGDRVWTTVVAVPRGEHRYMFVVDGDRWVTDPLAPAVKDDGFGGRNAILSL